MFSLVECFKSVQGEGIYQGYPAVFVRFQKCNLHCKFCDTDMTKAETISQAEVISRIVTVAKSCSTVVFTGGEPLLEPELPSLAYELYKHQGFSIHLETNGTLPLNGLENVRPYISLSPKIQREKCKIQSCTSLKILYPYLPGVQAGLWQGFPADEKSLQIIHPFTPKVIAAAVAELERLNLLESWKLGVQIHKYLNLR